MGPTRSPPSGPEGPDGMSPQLPGPPVAPFGKGVPYGPDPLAPSPLKRIAATIIVIGILYGAIYSMAEGTSTERFVQVGAAIGVLVYLLTFIDILIGLGFLIACVALSPELTLGGVGDLRLEDFLIPALLLSWIARATKDREPVITSPLMAPGLLYFAVMVVSSLVGIASGTTAPARSIAVLFKHVEYYLLFLLILNNVRSLRDFKALATFAVLSAAAGAMLVGPPVLTESGAMSERTHGPSGETANIFGGYLVLHLALAIGLFVFVRGAVLKFAALVSAVLMSTALLGTLSRTSYAAIAFALFVVGLLFERRLLAILAAGAVLFVALASEAASTRASDLLNVAAGGRNYSLDARLGAWQLVLSSLTGIHVLFGRGVGSINFGDVDSEYFRVLADTGILGLAIFAWILVRIGKMALALYRSQPRETFGHAYAVGFLIAFLAILVHAVASTSFISIRTMEGFLILAGLMAALHHHREEWAEVRPESGPVTYSRR